MLWFRIDNRLVHGQVIEAWLPYLHVRQLVVISDAVAEDAMQQQIMLLAIPGRITVTFVAVSAVKALYDNFVQRGVSALFLLAECADVQRIVEQGVAVPVLNVGNMHYKRGSQQLCAHVAASEEDLSCLRTLQTRGTVLDFRCVPGDAPVVEDW